MKKLLCLIVFLPTLFSCDAIWHNGATKLLDRIFEIARIKDVNSIEKAIARSNLWIRPALLERWHAYYLLDRGQRGEFAKLFQDSDLAKVKWPKLRHYDVVVILGGAAARAQIRVNFLIKLANAGITFDKIYLLGSTRKLKDGSGEDKELVPILMANQLKADEMAMVEYLWQQTIKPESLSLIPVTSFKAVEHVDGTRAGLADTLALVIKHTKITKGESFLLISNNPYVCLHDAIAKKQLKHYEVTIETVGDAMGEDPVEHVLDSVAKCLLNMQG